MLVLWNTSTNNLQHCSSSESLTLAVLFFFFFFENSLKKNHLLIKSQNTNMEREFKGDWSANRFWPLNVTIESRISINFCGYDLMIKLFCRKKQNYCQILRLLKLDLHLSSTAPTGWQKLHSAVVTGQAGEAKHRQAWPYHLHCTKIYAPGNYYPGQKIIKQPGLRNYMLPAWSSTHAVVSVLFLVGVVQELLVEWSPIIIFKRASRLIKFSSLSAPTKIEKLTSGSDEKHSAALPGIEPRVLRIPFAHSNHRATKPQRELRVNFRLSSSCQFFFHHEVTRIARVYMGSIPGGAAPCLFSSDPAVSSSIFVGAEREENLIRNDPNKSEFMAQSRLLVSASTKQFVFFQQYVFCVSTQTEKAHVS